MLPLHAEDLYAASHESEQALKIWDYLTYGPWVNEQQYKTTMRAQYTTFDTIFYVIQPLNGMRFEGQSSFLDISPLMGVIEIGYVWFGPNMI